MENADAVAPAGALLDLAGHALERLHGRVVFRLGVGDPKLAPLGGRNGDNCGDQQAGQSAEILVRNEGHEPAPVGKTPTAGDTRAHSVSREIECAPAFCVCRIFGRKTGLHFS
jgi:hypothetical protein